MREGNNLWCVVGANGVGKSSICDGLSKTKDFKRIERDTRLEGLWNEFGGFTNFVQALHGKREERRALLRILRKRIDELIRLLSKREAISKTKGASFLDALKRIPNLNDEQLIAFYCNEGDDRLYYLVRFLAEERSLEEALLATQNSSENVLLDDPHLLEGGNRMEIQRYFESLGLEPSILIIRATRQRIRDCAMQRFRSGKTQGVWSGRAAAGIEQLDQKIPSCPYPRVILHDNIGNIEDGIAAIRRRILDKDFDTKISWPLPLSTD